MEQETDEESLVVEPDTTCGEETVMVSLENATFAQDTMMSPRRTQVSTIQAIAPSVVNQTSVVHFVRCVVAVVGDRQSVIRNDADAEVNCYHLPNQQNVWIVLVDVWHCGSQGAVHDHCQHNDTVADAETIEKLQYRQCTFNFWRFLPCCI